MAKDFDKTLVYSALEVANICGVANQTAINWIRNGYLKAFNTPGGQYRVYADDLVSFMSGRKMRIPDILSSVCADSTKMKILIVEDESGLNTVIKTYFEKHFPTVTIFQAFDGFEAGAIMTREQPDVLILDLGLPGVNGFELCKKIADSDSFGNPTTIIITACQDTDIEKQIKDLNATCFFRKPVVLQELKEVVQSCLPYPPPVH